jgi:hypothetical protein
MRIETVFCGFLFARVWLKAVSPTMIEAIS